MIEISSKDNAIFKSALRLKDKRFRKADGAYLAEGERLVFDLIQYGFKADICYILAEKSMYDRHSTVLDGLKTFEITRPLSEKLSETEQSQGIYAVVRVPSPRPPSSDRMLYLDRIRDPGNLGSIVRSAAAFGFTDIVADDCADVFSPKTVRASMGCIAKVNFVAMDAEAVKAAGYRLIVADMDGVPVENFGRPDKVCLVVGNEADGVCERLRLLADGAVSVCMENVESLNAAVSAAVIMYQLNLK